MNDQSKQGILVVGHGSRRAEANDDVRRATRLIGERGNFPLIEAAFLEIELPSISDGFNRLVERGAKSITVHPYFLSPGRHTRGDVPRHVAEVSESLPGITYRITEPLAAHDLVISASIERIRETAASHEETDLIRNGTVYLVGAGPGDPGLLTVRAAELLRSCNVVIYDWLVNPAILDYVPTNAERIFVGKIGGGPQTPQDEINQFMVDHARSGKKVVRLKGGDPFIYGRGGEEAIALHEAGIAFKIVPGISSALAAPAYAGIPLTHRGLASSVQILTGTRVGSALNPALESNAETLVILMGASNIGSIAQDLINQRRAGETPAAVIQWGTYDRQATVTGTLQTIAVEAQNAAITAPAVIVVGKVVTLREQLTWFESSRIKRRSAKAIATTQRT